MRISSRSVPLLAAALLSGCLSRPSLVRQSFTFSVPLAASSAAGSGPVLGIRRITVASPFDTEAFAYRTGEYSYERDPYAGFLAAPEQSLAEPLRAYFRDSGFFRDVTEQGSALAPQVQLEITVSQLYGDFRDHAHPTARLQMRFVALKNIGGRAPDLVLQKDYVRNTPLQARTAAALVVGWNEGLRQIATEAAEDLNAAIK